MIKWQIYVAQISLLKPEIKEINHKSNFLGSATDNLVFHFLLAKAVFVLYVSLLWTGKPLYAEIAEWRKILARLACFLRSIDYSLQELMRHLVFSSVQRLLDHLVNSYHAPEEDELDNGNQVRLCSRDISDMLTAIISMCLTEREREGEEEGERKRERRNIWFL